MAGIFDTPMRYGKHAPEQIVTPPADSITHLGRQAVNLEDETYPGTAYPVAVTDVDIAWAELYPEYNPPEHQINQFVPGPEHDYALRDLNTAPDIGGVPGNNILVAVDGGPVTGRSVDQQWGAHQRLGAAPPGAHGPVSGGAQADYATLAAYATFQQEMERYSADAADASMVRAI